MKFRDRADFVAFPAVKGGGEVQCTERPAQWQKCLKLARVNKASKGWESSDESCPSSGDGRAGHLIDHAPRCQASTTRFPQIGTLYRF